MHSLGTKPSRPGRMTHPSRSRCSIRQNEYCRVKLCCQTASTDRPTYPVRRAEMTFLLQSPAPATSSVFSSFLFTIFASELVALLNYSSSIIFLCSLSATTNSIPRARKALAKCKLDHAESLTLKVSQSSLSVYLGFKAINRFGGKHPTPAEKEGQRCDDISRHRQRSL